jgi:hypothetical protein
MPSTFGINSLTGTLLESVDVEHKADLKELINKDGTHSASRSVDDSFSFTVKGKGTTSISVGANSSAAPSGVSGKIIVTNVTKTQTNDDWEGFTYSGTGYAHAT